MKNRSYGIALIIFPLVLITGYFWFYKSGQIKSQVSFNYQVRPLLSGKCFTCHGPDSTTREAGLRLDNFEGATALLKSGNRAIVPGNAPESALIGRIHNKDPEQIMPPPESNKTLSEEERAILKQWIEEGAEYEPYWAFIKPQKAPEDGRVIDDFIIEKLKENGTNDLSPLAEKETLLRRASYVLTGLPPTPMQLTAWLNDKDEGAWERVVDRLLESPRFGERWARHWMDLVRYSETKGHEFDYPVNGAWHYRDYLIRAFNKDVPYNQLVREHLSGDIMERPRKGPNGTNESVKATMFFNFSEGKHSPVSMRQEEADAFDNIIDVTSKAFQGTTLACARCHDHKFDPVPTTDYYALYGTLESSRITPHANLPMAIADRATSAIAQYKKQLEEHLEIGNEATERQVPAETEDLKVLGDFSDESFQGWYSDGTAFGPAPAGYDPVIDTVSYKLTSRRFGGASGRYYGTGIFGALRSPNFIIEKDKILVRARGAKSDLRIIINNFQLIQDPIYGELEMEVNTDEYTDFIIDVSPWKGEKFYIEALTGKYDRHSYSITDDAWMEVAFALAYNGERPSYDTPPDVRANKEVQRGPMRIYKEMVRRGRDLRTKEFFHGLTEGDGLNSPVFIRGNRKLTSKEKVSRGFLSVLPSVEVRHGSGRKELADIILHPDNPLTARVMVNRIWKHVFGRGIVETVDNFGLQGKLPSHPKLLDHLAVRFVEGGWSVKKLIKEMVMTRTFRQNTRRTPELDEFDPENILLGTYPVRRLESEAIRDGILAVTGALDTAMFGPSVPVHLTGFMQGRGRPRNPGPLDGDGRRSVYIEVRRNFMSPFMTTFDAPHPATTIGNRTATNVPSQSLTLMNDPFVLDQAEKWADGMIKRGHNSWKERVTEVYLWAFSRNPDIEELKESEKFLLSLAEGETGPGLLKNRTVWKDYCHTIINLKEFIYLL